MKIKLDENMPLALEEMLRFHGHDVSTVPEERLSGAKDSEIVKRATAEDRLLMTYDLDFGDIRSYPIATHSGIVVFRLRDQRWAAMENLVERLLACGLLDRLRPGLAIVDENRIRSAEVHSDNHCRWHRQLVDCGLAHRNTELGLRKVCCGRDRNPTYELKWVKGLSP